MSSRSSSSAARDTSNSFCLLNYYQHTLTDADCSVWQGMKSRWHYALLYRHYAAMNNLSHSLLSDGAKALERHSQRDTGTDTDHHVMSDCRAKGLLQERLRVCDSTGGNFHWEL
ncbi:hypothetical protein VZT92_001291 [Zoarces viviparus]|uniref:Uncharacterized protein n=1 Tax=Zoarces viviparus TaxID=48416 RepID=A0AAW1G3S6_ZOAVI